MRAPVEQMLQAQAHRGPDHSGVWCGVVQGVEVALGSTRLKVLDITDASNQPMISEDGRFVLVYNGEVYNYVELREQLRAEGIRFRTEGDTEVVLSAIIHWGQEAFAKFNGMWALVLLDTLRGTVVISRDRFGVKPLYIWADDQTFLLSSEIKGILEVASRKFRVSATAVNDYLCQDLLCVGSSTFFEGIEEFPAGHFANVSIQQLRTTSLEKQRYWNIPSETPEILPEAKLIETIQSIFLDSVKLRLRSDVGVGILLSGGIDSSAIAAAVHQIDPYRENVRLISAVGEGEDSEQPFIDLMGAYLGRDVDKVVLNYPPSRAFDLISEASWYNDEPIGSFSTVAHFLLMQYASERGVTVLLSGQGADELLCGYKKYLGFYLQELCASGRFGEAARVMGGFLRRGTLLSGVSYQEGKRYLPPWLRIRENDIRGPALLEQGNGTPIGLNGGGVGARANADIERLSIPALIHYEDRMSMAVGKEIRLPFLDYRLVNWLAPMPVENKLRDGWTKWIFRRAMEPFLPPAIAWRKDKQYFSVPQEQWLKHELRDEISSLLKSDWVSEALGLIDKNKFRNRYDAYLKVRTKNSRFGIKDLFPPIALELWARRFGAYICSGLAVMFLLPSLL
jgi:asparagine synthase (glutamine-hydrolysing)